MTEINCENVRIASMAEADGFSPLLSKVQVEAHIATCDECRQELREMESLSGLLGAVQRSKQHEQIWPLIEQRIEDSGIARNRPFDWRPFLILGFLLAAYKILLMVNGQGFGLWFKLLPVALLIAAFAYVKENPLKINSQLRLEGVTS